MPILAESNRGHSFWGKTKRMAILEAVFDCPGELAHEIAASMAHKSFEHREPILHQGDDVAQCHLVIEGRANAFAIGLEGQYVQLATYEPGELFGAYPQQGSQRADILADNGLQILSIESGRLSAFAKTHADVGSGLARIFAGQMDVLFDRMAARATLSAVGRVYAELLRRADGENRISPVPVVAALAVSVQTTRETASRAISKLERRGRHPQDK